MDQDCNTGLCLGMNISIGTTTRAEDQKYADPRRPVNGAAPLQLDLFPLTSVLPPDTSSSALLPASGTLPWEKTSPGNDGGCDGSRSAGEAMDAIRPVPVSRRFDVNKFPPSCYSNKEAGAINVSSSNSTVDSNAINSKSGYAMDSKRKLVATQELDNKRACSRVLSDVKEKGRAKKKLRLSKDQWVLLQESFSKDSTPELNQKQALARQLNLRTKQVKVWFQNRRARTKLKQTEMDYELLKRCNESLTDENRKLQKELEELRSLKLASPLLPATTLTVCPCCETVASARQ